jgi:glucose/arabinose dehydrogenase
MVVRLDRSTLLRSGLLGGLAGGLATAVDPAASGAVRRSGLRGAGVITHGIDVPWNIRFLPGYDSPTALVSCRDSGNLLLVSHGSVRKVGHFDVVSRPVVAESGLLGLVLHPAYSTNRLVYAYVSTHRDNRVVRFTFDGTVIGRPRPVLTGIRRAHHHNGGGVAFGPDGMLYISTGENEIKRLAQDKHSLNGKVLRVTDTGATPSDNPFGNPVWSYGHRNPEGIAFDEQGRLWATEFGDHEHDEVNQIRRGRNYGWPRVEGSDGPGGYTDPIVQLRPNRCSPSGIAIARGRAWIGALEGECVYSVVLEGSHAGRAGRQFHHGQGRTRAVSLAPDGTLWVGTSNRDGRAPLRRGDDHIFRVALPA